MCGGRLRLAATSTCMLVVAGAEVTQNRLRGKKNSHTIALDIKLYSWKTLLRCEKNWPAIRKALRSNVDVALTLFRNGSWAA